MFFSFVLKMFLTIKVLSSCPSKCYTKHLQLYFDYLSLNDFKRKKPAHMRLCNFTDSICQHSFASQKVLFCLPTGGLIALIGMKKILPSSFPTHNPGHQTVQEWLQAVLHGQTKQASPSNPS